MLSIVVENAEVSQHSATRVKEEDRQTILNMLMKAFSNAKRRSNLTLTRDLILEVIQWASKTFQRKGELFAS